MSGGSKGATQAGNTTSTSGPAAYMMPYVATALGQANKLLSYQPQYYAGTQMAGFSQPQQQAMQGIVNLGMNGTPALNAAQGFDQTLLAGGGSNPYLDQTFQKAAQATQNQLSSEFAGAGRDMAASAPLRAEQLNNLATGIYGGNYQNTLQDALNAGNQAQSLYGTQLQGLGAAEGVGQQVQQQAQNEINANMNKYNYYQQLPFNTLQRYEQSLGGVQGGSAQTSPYYTNPTANTLGLALGAEQLYNGYQGKGGTSPSQGGTH